jgi:ADP-heptose:LPS heptosyltransferase
VGEHAGALMGDGNREVKQILVLELWNIGDVVLVLPFLQQLRAIFPSARTVLVGRSYAQELLAPTGLVDEFIETSLGWEHARRTWNPFAYPWRELWRVVRELRKRSFDIAFQCRPHQREHLILALSGAKRRVGMSTSSWDRLLTDRVRIDVFAEQKKQSWLRLLDPFGGAQKLPPRKLEASPLAREQASRFLATRGVSTEDVIVGVHPGASVREKRWPIDRFAEVVRSLQGRRGVRVLVFVEPEGYGSALKAKDGRIVAQVSLPEMVALLERCDLLVCNDSGPMHVAGALGVPCVAVFSSGIEQMFEPLGQRHRVVVPGGGRTGNGAEMGRPQQYDVTGVPVERVLGAIEQALG